MSLFGGAECSTSRNPLSQFTKHTNEDRSLQRPGIHQGINGPGAIREETRMNQQDQQRMNQFYNGQDSFNFQPMNNELSHIHAPLHHHQQPTTFRPGPTASTTSNWSSEFKNDIPAQHSGSLRSNHSAWSSEFKSASPLNSNSSLNEQHHHQPYNNPMMRSRGFNPVFQGYQNGMVNHIQPIQTNSKLTEVGDNEQWETHFKEIDEQFQDAFSKQEGKLNEDNQLEKEPEIIIDDKYQTNFDEVWDSLNSQEIADEFNSEPSWEKDFATYAQARANFGKYQFENSNQFLNNPNAYEIGLTLMENGAKLSEAALAFEAAIQENPQHINAWLKLGEVQTQNEKEIAGLTALEKCLSLDPKNLSALMTLAVSYINEGYDNAAFATLERWIETKYPQVTDKARLTNPKINDEDRFSLNKRVTELFIQAAQLSPSGANIDADVQMGLGVLFYANEDFQKTIDCFKAAIAVRPDDELLWNRLGASLANSNRSEEAIEAYKKALQLKPSFVRARYNLGVSSINIGCYKEAAEHLLSALSMHKVEGLDDDDLSNNAMANQSTSILETLKRAFIALDRRDLIEKVKPGMNLNQFRDEFNF
ncbi:Peroxisomal targeting signal receptor [Wickerhamomyces ciferrii]|uniref:Peroxisomal targeting signal receptor n=1 Tax=Wickerhamomyces ciferrii (strain ATCC 14091 / BCRC 22168 / CBS 111 / JCM 3599 / NBRC 0793 / NRRL Y-1031 F-60-10) TaxID=1206466 RepID=K0KZU3_WICCF|nr:Peroxisomal targeting signal receptor [Wickerhamomyces ciferrii]CCH46673.1 Peroxisomal targeting signal receptor [Wickerhamomyces ciferrii]